MEELSKEIIDEVFTQALDAVNVICNIEYEQILASIEKCEIFKLYQSANDIVNSVLTDAYKIIEENESLDVPNYVDDILSKASRKVECLKENPFVVSSIEEILSYKGFSTFDSEKGIKIITDVISQWKINEEWKYLIQYHRKSQDDCFDYYKYKAIFSIPCPSYPIPQATASVYFTLLIYKIGKTEYLAAIWYSIEGSRLQHSVTDGSFFNEHWLYRLLLNKIYFFKRMEEMNI